MKLVIAIAASTLMAGCAQQSAVPLGNHMMRIDVSAAPVYGRAGAQAMASRKAAEATLAAGYERYSVIDNQAWTVAVPVYGSSANVSGMPAPGMATVQGSSSTYATTMQKPETSMVIKMYHKGDPGFDEAIDARRVVGQAG